uniref:Uncharacterized protein n=1 Tax=Knipowitschia caucasica TaxID=637954 RepID=A0AAV2J038_KNICA
MDSVLRGTSWHSRFILSSQLRSVRGVLQGQLRTPPACLVCVLSHTITVGHPVLRASCAGSLGERFTQRIHGPVFSSLSFSLLLSCLGSCFPAHNVDQKTPPPQNYTGVCSLAPEAVCRAYMPIYIVVLLLNSIQQRFVGFPQRQGRVEQVSTNFTTTQRCRDVSPFSTAVVKATPTTLTLLKRVSICVIPRAATRILPPKLQQAEEGLTKDARIFPIVPGFASLSEQIH